MTQPTPQPDGQREPIAPAVPIACAEAVTLLIDTHVHLYTSAVSSMFAHAAQRFTKAAAAQGTGEDFVACLMLTETERDKVFIELLEQKEDFEGWRTEGVGDSAALWTVHPDHGRLLVIAGGQTVTAEGVEVLSLGTRDRFVDGQPIDTTIESVIDAGALAVLPYGLGKWLGQRGKIVAQAMEGWHERGVRLGDNAGRPNLFTTPDLFKRAKQLGYAVLPGSDPLRTGHGTTAAGSYGVVVNSELDEDDPAGSVKQALSDLAIDAPLFGGRVGMTRCVSEQLSLRLNKYIGR